MKKLLLISIALFVTAGFLSVAAQNNKKLSGQMQTRNTSPDYPDFETSGLQMLKKAKTEQDWWEPDTLITYSSLDGKVNLENEKFIFKYNPQGLLQEKRNDGIAYFTGNDPWRYYSTLNTYTYDSNNNLLIDLQIGTGLRENIEITSWVNTYQISNTYNSENNIQSQIYQKWESDSWVNNYQYTYTYDSNSNLLTELYQNWENNSWINYSQIVHTYDSSNNQLTELRQNWKGDSWINNYQITRTYDSNNNILELHQKWESNIWSNAYQYFYTYDTNNNLITRLRQRPKDNSWENNYQYVYTYDSNNNMLNDLYQVWWDNSWENKELITYAYDSNNNMLTKLYQSRIGEDENLWENERKFLMTYDDNGNGASVEFWLWLPHEESWISINDSYFIKLYYNNMQSFFEVQSRSKISASYKKVSGSGVGIESVPSPGLNTISVHPNPTTGYLRIENGDCIIQRVSIYNNSGLNVLNTKKSMLDISHLPAGMYFVQITTDKGCATEKIVKK